MGLRDVIAQDLADVVEVADLLGHAGVAQQQRIQPERALDLDQQGEGLQDGVFFRAAQAKIPRGPVDFTEVF